MSEVRIYGIRHHGPGSAARLLEALEGWQPDILLIELPEDAQSLIERFHPEDMTPPVAMLLYDPKNFNQAAYFPLAVFSPEWQALVYAFRNKIPVRAIDLPMGVFFKNTFDVSKWAHHPFRELARQTAYEDTEQWWDHFIEQQPSEAVLFSSIRELMGILREKATISEENRIREKHMHSRILRAVEENHPKIAVICGAYHSPALEDYSKSPSGHPKKLTSVPTEAVWIPWSYERLTHRHAYGAGVHQPMWYENIFLHKSEAPMQWIAFAVHELRKKEHRISSASGIETIRLAEGLRQMRGKTTIGLPELTDAATSVIFEGKPNWRVRYFHELFIGNTTGHIQQDLFSVPLQADFRARLRKARLSKVLEDTSEVQKTLDLRNTKHKEHSGFFFQTRYLDIPLAALQDPSLSARGQFKEIWNISWDPASEWTLIQAGTYGTTVESAAFHKMERAIREAKSLEDLVPLLETAFLCSFPELFQPLQDRILEIYSLSETINPLLLSLRTLTFVNQYGDIRYSEKPDVAGLIDRIGARAAYLLPFVAGQLSEEEDAVLRTQLRELQYILTSPHYRNIRNHFSNAWLQILFQNNDTDYYHGIALKFVIHQKLTGEVIIHQQFFRHLSTTDPEQTTDWLTGLISGDILWIGYDQVFQSRLNQWLGDLDEEMFHSGLPALRSIFSLSNAAERRQLFNLISGRKEKITENPLRTGALITTLAEELMQYFFPDLPELSNTTQNEDGNIRI